MSSHRAQTATIPSAPPLVRQQPRLIHLPRFLPPISLPTRTRTRRFLPTVRTITACNQRPNLFRSRAKRRKPTWRRLSPPSCRRTCPPHPLWSLSPLSCVSSGFAKGGHHRRAGPRHQVCCSHEEAPARSWLIGIIYIAPLVTNSCLSSVSLPPNTIPNAAPFLNLYAPRRTRGIGADKHGLCPICAEPPSRGGKGKAMMLNMKVSHHSTCRIWLRGVAKLDMRR